MARSRTSHRGAPTKQTRATPNVKIDLKAAAKNAAIVVGDGEYDIEIVDADLAVNERKNTISLRLTPMNIETKERIRLQPLCIHDGGAGNVPWYVETNAKLVTDLIEAAGRDVPDDLSDLSILKGARVTVRLIEQQDTRGLSINNLAEVFELEGVGDE